MAKTDVTTAGANNKELFSAAVFKRTRQKSFFLNGLESKSGIVKDYTELDKQGDVINLFEIDEFDYRQYSTEGEDHEINTKSMTINNDSMTLVHRLIAHRDAGPMARKRPAFILTNEAIERLSTNASELIDATHFSAAQTSVNTVRFAGSATSNATLTASDLLNPDLLSDTKTFAVGQANQSGASQHMLMPLDFGGRPGYVLAVSEDQFNDLTKDADWANRAVHAAEKMVGVNPIFDGGDRIYHNGILVMPHQMVYSASDAGSGSNVAYSRSILMGKDALAFAWGAKPVIDTDFVNLKQERIDFYSLMYAIKKPVFNSLDQGLLGLNTARTNTTAQTTFGILTI